MLHLYALVVAASTAVLIFAGGLVTSTGSGLSVPDWPNSYGWFMFTFPIENMVGGIFYEHSHRLIASTVGFLILVMAGVLWRVEAACLGQQAGLHRAGGGDHPGHPRRHHRAVVPARPDFDRARQPGADRLLPDDGDCRGHCAGMAAFLLGVRRRARRCHAAEGGRRHHGARLPADRHRRHHAAYRRRAGDPRLSLGVRPAGAAALEPADRRPLRPPGRRAHRGGDGAGHGRARPVSPPPAPRARTARRRPDRRSCACRSRSAR